jgi:TonB family protein
MLAIRPLTMVVVAVQCIGCIEPAPVRAVGTGARPQNWGCEFPKEAEDAGIDQARIRIRVQVDPNGRATGATLVEGDAGHGFGLAALECAARQRYFPALNEAGQRVAGIADFWIRYIRMPPEAGPP